MKKILLFLLLCTTSRLIAQDTIPLVEEDEDSVQFTPYGSMEVWYSVNHGSHAIYTPDGTFDASKEGAFGAYTFGTGFVWQKTERLALHFGAEINAMRMEPQWLQATSIFSSGASMTK